MSRSNAPLQATINRWVNPEAIGHYAASLEANAERIADYHWLDDEVPAAHTEAIENLRAAAVALRIVMNRATAAEQAATTIHYDHLYRRGHWAQT